MNVIFRKLKDSNKNFTLLYNWCKKSYIYEWFEQRELSFDEIVNKYRNKLNNKEQDLFIIRYDDKDIGFVQIYKFINDKNIKNISNYKNIYEFDIFIGEEEYLSKGIGTIIIKELNNMIYSNYKADAIVLRPFKRNVRAIKCYEKCGYKIIDKYESVDTLNNSEEIIVLINML